MYLRIEEFDPIEKWSVRSEENEKLFYGTISQCESYMMALEREKNISKRDFDKQKPFATSPIGGTIRNINNKD